MKKLRYGIFFLLFFVGISPIFASTNTYERTEEDYRVPNDITVTEERIPYIMTTPSVDETEKVYDFADLFTDAEEKEIYSEISSFIQKDHTDLVVVTIDENPKYTELQIFDKDQADMVYADDFYDYNDFGYENTRDGVLILVDMDNRYIYISGSGASQYIYTDEKCVHITDSMTSNFASGQYAKAVKKAIHTLDEYYKLGEKSDKGYTIDGNGNLVRDYHIPVLLGISFICTLIVMIILYSKNRMVRLATSGSAYLNQTQTKVNCTKDKFVNMAVSRVRIHENTSSGGFGGGGGHSGSSGHSHSGGGSHF